jgi:hypothetical protein
MRTRKKIIKSRRTTFHFIFVFLIIGLSLIFIGIASKNFAQTAGGCQTKPVTATTFIRTYHLRDLTDAYGLSLTKDGGYLLTGDTVWSSGMSVWNPFAIKTDAKGSASWSRQFSSQSAAQGVLAETRRPSVQMPDGSFVVAEDIIDFYDDAYEAKKEGWGDVLVTKLSAKGVRLWSTMIGDYSMDFPQQLWAMPDGGVLSLAKLKKTGYVGEIADFDAVPDYSVLVNIDKNGKVRGMKRMDWTATDMKRLADGGFIALADIDPRATIQPDMGSDAAFGAIPTIIRLDGNLNVLWAKSIEAPPMSYAMATGTTPADFRMIKMTFRLPAGDFESVEETADGGFIAFGRFFDAANLIARNPDVDLKKLAQSVPSFAVKVDGDGNLRWAKSLRTGFGTYDVNVKTVKTADQEFVLLRNVTRGDISTDLTQFAGNVELVKVDAEFNPRWVKKIDIERDATASDLRATPDGGVAVAGRIVTNARHMVMGSLEPYEEALLIKTDANGNVAGTAYGAAEPLIEGADQSRYVVMRDMSVRAEDAKAAMSASVKPKVTAIKNTARSIAAARTARVTPACSLLAAASSTAGGSGAAPTAKTWAEINYESAREGEIETEKSREIHNELLPTLNELFGRQVKMTDNTSGLWLSYFFPRIPTRADVEAVQRMYEGLGYKIDESDGGTLAVSKIGRSLRLTFSTASAMVGKLEVFLW